MSEPRSPSALGRIITRSIQIGTVLVIAVAAVFAYLMYPVWRSYPATSFPAAADEAEGNRQDLEYLSRLPEIDRSFTKEKRRTFERAVERLVPQSDIFDRAKLTLEAARLTAIADNAHTNVLTELGDATFKSVPIRLGLFSDGLFVVKARAEERDLIGAQLIAVNERPIDAVISSFRP